MIVGDWIIFAVIAIPAAAVVLFCVSTLWAPKDPPEAHFHVGGDM